MLTLLPILLLNPQTAPAPPPPPRWEGPPPAVTPSLCRAVGNHLTQLNAIGDSMNDPAVRAALDRALVESGGKPMTPDDAESRAADERDKRLAAAVVARYRKTDPVFQDVLAATRMPAAMQRSYAASCLDERK